LTSRLTWSNRSRQGIALIGLLVVLTLAVLAVWPAPGKYPWRAPGLIAASAFLGAHRWRSRDDVGALMVSLVTVAGLGTWTLSSWLELSLGMALALAVALLVALVRSGSADHPDH
jgi:hypothetical protein